MHCGACKVADRIAYRIRLFHVALCFTALSSCCHEAAILAFYGLRHENDPGCLMSNTPPRSRWIRRAKAGLAAVFLAGCAGGDSGPSTPQLGLSCVDDSPHCISQRGKVFDSYMADKSRTWVKQPASPTAYASGVRLFALSKRRKDLSCDELKHGKREADAASGALRGPGGSGLTPAQVSRGVMLAGDVSRELSREIGRRC